MPIPISRLHRLASYAVCMPLVCLLSACVGQEPGGDSSLPADNNSSQSPQSSSAVSSSSMAPVSSASVSSAAAVACQSPVNVALGLAGTYSTLDSNVDDTAGTAAFDGDSATRWSSDYGDDEWLAVDLGRETTLCGFNLSWEAAFAAAYAIEGSLDGDQWQALYQVQQGSGGEEMLTLATAQVARHVRFKGLQRATEWGYSFWEFEILGDLDGPPVPKISAPTSVVAGGEVIFDGSGSADPGGFIASYQWDFGDGASATGASVSHLFGATGLYTVRLTVTDNDQNVVVATHTVTVRENLAEGKALYDEQCAFCHGDNGEGTNFGTPLSAAKWQGAEQDLIAAIDQTMPKGNVTQCQGACASAVANYIMTFAPATADNCADQQEPLKRSLRLLTNREYQNTVNDLFMEPAIANVAASFPGGVRVHGYDNNAFAESVGESRMGVYWNAANQIAEAAINNRFTQIVGCDQLTRICASSFITNFGRKVFRRPLTNEERTAYEDLFLSGANAREGATKVIKGWLISPNFLYRPEQGVQEGEHYRLTPWESATLLAYTFTGSTPDDALLDAAANNRLNTREDLVAQVTRLLASPKASANMVDFARQWLMLFDFKDVTKDTRVYSGFTDAVKQGMDEEFTQFMPSVLLNADAQFSDLYVSDYTFANAALADYYGINGAGNNTARVATNGERGGILKLGALLARQGKANDTSPVLRGVFVRKHLLCQPMPLPDATLEINIPLPEPGVTPRERFSQHSADPSCASCHQYIDDLGFGFDTFDGAGKAVSNPDDIGVLTGLNALTDPDRHPFKGVHELSDILAGAHSAAACLIENFQIYATGQEHQDRCSVQSTAKEWQTQNYSFDTLWQEIVLANTFLIRQ